MSNTSQTREALNAQQFGSTAANYVKSPVHAQGPDLQQIAEIASRYPGAKVIDLGCGGGHVSYALAPLVGSVVAYDLLAEMVAAVEVEAAKRGLANLTVKQGPAEALPFGDATFDAVFCRYTAHHWPDVRKGLREARRVLKDGGVAVFSDVIAPEAPVLDTFLQTFEMLRDPSHVRNYSVPEWVAIVAQAGFAVTGVTRRRLPLDFEQWVGRMRTSAVHVAAIKSLHAAVSDEVRQHFAIEAGSFTIDQAVFELACV